MPFGVSAHGSNRAVMARTGADQRISCGDYSVLPWRSAGSGTSRSSPRSRTGGPERTRLRAVSQSGRSGLSSPLTTWRCWTTKRWDRLRGAPTATGQMSWRSPTPDGRREAPSQRWICVRQCSPFDMAAGLSIAIPLPSATSCRSTSGTWTRRSELRICATRFLTQRERGSAPCGAIPSTRRYDEPGTR